MWYPTDHTLGLRRNGVNHVGLENPFQAPNTEPVAGTTYPVTGLGLLQQYANGLGMRSARVVVSWESLQNNPDPLPQPPFGAAAMGAVPPSNVGGYGDYWKNLVKLVIRLIDLGIYVTVCPLQHNPDANSGSGDTDLTYRGKPFEAEHLADFWGKFATALNQAVAAGFPPDPEFPAKPARRDRLALDLINEPHQSFGAGVVGITVGKWVICAKAAIQAIRANPANANTIFVEGMGYASPDRETHRVDPGNPASHLLWEDVAPSDPLKKVAISVHCYSATFKLPTKTPSPKPPDALRNACKDLVDWARQHGFKVHIGEVALDAGVDGNGCSDKATAQGQWADWSKFCLQNDDVIVGWNWWGNTSQTWGWSTEGSCKGADPTKDGSRTWALTQNDGATWTTYVVDVIKDSSRVPELVIRDNMGDSGAEPNATATYAYESPDIWVRKIADDVYGDEKIKGGTSCVVYVNVTNRGEGPYPADGNDVVALYWAKASAGLGVPEPWNGKVNNIPDPRAGGLVGSALVGASDPAGPVPAKTSKWVKIAWAPTPNPDNYPDKDGHFCLIAVIAKDFNPLAEFAHEGLDPPDLSASVLKLNNVAWHNIHIDSPNAAGGMMMLGAALLANHTLRPMRALLALEVLDAWARPVDPRPGDLLITPGRAAVEKIQGSGVAHPMWENLGHGTFAVLDPKAATPDLILEPGESLGFGLSYRADRGARGYAVRAIQYAREGAFKGLVGGQTFVVGEVEGFTSWRGDTKA